MPANSKTEADVPDEKPHASAEKNDGSVTSAKEDGETKRAAGEGDGGEQHPHDHQISESTEGIHDWKKRPPYRIHDDNDKFPVKYEASCHCGRVEYQLSRETPLDCKLCHCTTCQVQHGEFVEPAI